MDNLLSFSRICKSYLNISVINDKEFAREFVLFRRNAFIYFHNGLIISNSHGINYFDNVIKYWNNPIEYISGLKQSELDAYSKQKIKDDYEKNFILILIENKSKHEKRI